MSNQFGGYRHFPGYGWIPKITSEEYSSNDSWEYYDADFEDLFIIAYNHDTNLFAWVEGSDTNDRS